MSSDKLFIGYGSVLAGRKTFKDVEEIKELNLLPDIHETYNRKTRSFGDSFGFIEPYESYTPFFGHFVYDEDEMFFGLPSITDEEKRRVHDWYASLDEKVRSRLTEPNWVIYGHLS